MFQLHIFDDKIYKTYFLEYVGIKCRDCNKETGLYLKDTIIEEITTQFVLHKILHHLGMPMIICSNNEMLYETEGNNHPNWFNKGPCYYTAICSKFYGNVFKYFIKDMRIDRCILICYINAHDKQQPECFDDESSGVSIPIPKNITT